METESTDLIATESTELIEPAYSDSIEIESDDMGVVVLGEIPTCEYCAASLVEINTSGGTVLGCPHVGSRHCHCGAPIINGQCSK